MHPLTHIETPFPQKFGIPRQPLLVEEAWGKLVFTKDDFFAEAFRGIENFTHLWLIFAFNGVEDKTYPALVYPPRFQGKQKLGVFATRSPHRPNRLGLSVVQFDRLEVTGEKVILWVKGVDLLSGTPIYDIKPYIPYCDSVPSAKATLFEDAPVMKHVVWDCECLDPVVKSLIEKVIGLDPRPGQDQTKNFSYGVSVGGYNVRFESAETGFRISEMVKE